VDRRAKVELFEQIRREYEHGGGTIRGIAKKLGIHRRMVREAVLSAVPVERKTPVRERPKLEPAMAFIDAILEAYSPSELQADLDIMIPVSPRGRSHMN
jgi:hypothetical protein